jgi:hypothetical protein
MSTMTVSTAAASPVRLPYERQEEFEGLIQALCINRRSAMVVCPQADELDRVSRFISSRLKRVPELRLEVVRPIGAESLIDRFNEMVAALPLKVARREGVPDQPLTLWVMNLSRRLELPEVKLLLNLVQSFPGTGVRLLLLCSRDAATPEATVAAYRWGSRLHRWVLQPDQELPPEPAAPKVTSGATVAPAALEAISSRHQILRAMAVRFEPLWRGVLRAARAACHPIVTRTGLDRVSGRLNLRFRAPGSRWVWGMGGLMMSLGATAGAWWHTRLDLTNGATTPLRRPVPEIVELIEDVRPQAVRQEQRS